MRPLRAFVSACALAAFAWAAPARSDEPAEPPGQTSPPSADAPAAPAPTSPAAAAPATKRQGVAVVLVGPWDDTQARHTRDLARGVYRTPKLRPDLDEGTARILSGGEPSGDDAQAKKLAELRSQITPDLTSQASRDAIAGLAAELPVGAIVLFVPGATGPVVRLAHVDGTKTPPGVRLDPASIAPSPKEGQPDMLDLDPVLTSLERLIAPKAEVTPPPAKPAAKPQPKAGPRKDNLKKGGTKDEPAKPQEESSWYESPWFWVAVGGVAATGITILVVSQTTDVDEGSVALKGKVLSQGTSAQGFFFKQGFVW